MYQFCVALKKIGKRHRRIVLQRLRGETDMDLFNHLLMFIMIILLKLLLATHIQARESRVTLHLQGLIYVDTTEGRGYYQSYQQVK